MSSLPRDCRSSAMTCYKLVIQGRADHLTFFSSCVFVVEPFSQGLPCRRCVPISFPLLVVRRQPSLSLRSPFIYFELIPRTALAVIAVLLFPPAFSSFSVDERGSLGSFLDDAFPVGVFYPGVLNCSRVRNFLGPCSIRSTPVSLYVSMRF